MYMNGTVGYFEVLLESKNFEDLLVRIDLLQRIIESDTDLILQMEVDQANVEEKKANLENEQTKLVTLQDEMTVKKSELKAQIAELEEKQIKLEEDIEAVAIQIDEINEDAEKVKAIIEDLKLQELYAGGKMIWPVDGYRTISSPFGNRIHPILGVYKMHTGIDIPCPTGTKIMAAQQGTVIWSNWLSSYGKAIMIDHGGGIVTLYAHNSSLIVKKGDKIVKGQVIALSGSTGNSTGPHLHFEVRENGEYVDPMIEWLQASEY
ncbi:MAG: peptidoglycan DD-metalloendopeptidase family protein [Clostridia bacterium]|nr:peptidoglycan DD-metalloendopeptidase family protein [Clostridia bacterium]